MKVKFVRGSGAKFISFFFVRSICKKITRQVLKWSLWNNSQHYRRQISSFNLSGFIKVTLTIQSGPLFSPSKLDAALEASRKKIVFIFPYSPFRPADEKPSTIIIDKNFYISSLTKRRRRSLIFQSCRFFTCLLPTCSSGMVEGKKNCLTREEKFKQVARFILRSHNMQQHRKRWNVQKIKFSH
jgi:hypothetical protein